DKIIQQQYIL
ncbi:hypothetical protein D047_4903B, partial [Vibrio parahaemolyticus VPTS-2010_2]